MISFRFYVCQVTVADFSMYEILDQLRRMQSDSLDTFPKLLDFLRRVEVLPQVKEYLVLESVRTLPINSKIAAFK